jgi:hypothetical protein
MANRGNIVVVLLLMILLAASGLALLTHTGLHAQVVAARGERRLAGAAGGQALLLRLHRYREKLAGADMNAFLEPEREFFNNDTFPDLAEDEWLSCHRFRLISLPAGDGFRVVRILDHVRAAREGGRLALEARAGVDLVAGDVPAGELGLLVAHGIEDTPASFLAGHGVEYAGSQLPLVGSFPVSSETRRLLGEALGMPAQAPDWRRIREKFNLEPGDAPVPPGVYLARSEAEVASVFVEGDLQKLEFSAGEGWQSIRFEQDGRRSELRYRPGSNLLTWSGSEAVDGLCFAEKVVVHGSVWDIRQEGAAAFLAEARIELLACGRLVVRTGLESENLAIGRERVPGLLLMTCDRDFFSDETIAADVVMDTEGKKTVQAQVIAAGALVNGGAHVEITGGVYAEDIENAGRLKVDGASGRFAFGSGVRLTDFKFLKDFRVHFIQEGSDDE